MISRREIRELAAFHADARRECALSFYFQPQTPRDKSHREEMILAKDLIKSAMREIKHNGKNTGVAEDLHRMLEVAQDLRGNQTQAKVIFACGKRNFWREFDLPPWLPGSAIATGHRFHLKPLLTVMDTRPKTRVVLLDRKKARLFDLYGDEILEREGLFRSVPRRGRSDGWRGYDAGHAERGVEDEVMRHFRDVAAHLKDEWEKGKWEKWIAGCLDANWHDFESRLHPEIKQLCVGQFSATADMSAEQARESANEIFRNNRERHNRELVKQVLSYAKSHKRGVTGLRRVLRSLELGEVRALLVTENYAARGVECTSCGRLDAHLVRYCALCGHSTRKLDDIVDAMVPLLVRRDIELVCVSGQELEPVGNIAALLRYRAANHDHRLADAS
ncbi:MAG TPA: hypothetical protein VN684_12245 [Terriglobales bacterium]|nr:hypothetical protein [Terriglobales bacterium]